MHRIGSVSPMAGQISMGARREVVLAVMGTLSVGGTGGERSDTRRTVQSDRLASEARGALALGVRSTTIVLNRPRRQKPTYGSIIKDAVVALWEASDRVCRKRLQVMIPTLLPALERARPVGTEQSRSAGVGAGSRCNDDRPPAGRLQDRSCGAANARRVSVSTPRSVRRFRSEHSATGTIRHPGSARSTWWRTAARR